MEGSFDYLGLIGLILLKKTKDAKPFFQSLRGPGRADYL